MHLEFSTRVYRIQIQSGRYFTHEHPKSATSWKEPAIDTLSREEGVIKVDLDMCAFGLKTKDGGKEGYAKKSTTIMTNSPYVAWRVNRKCNKAHDHVHLLNSKAGPAQKFTKQLCRAIAKGMVEQKVQWLSGVYTILRIDPDDRTHPGPSALSSDNAEGSVGAILSLGGKTKEQHDAEL